MKEKKKMVASNFKKPNKKEGKKSFRLPKKLLILISLTEIDEKEGSFSDFERYLGHYSPKPEVREILKLLLEKEILTFKERVTNANLYRLDQKKLIDFIMSMDEMLLIHSFYEKHHTIMI
jgi:hypothetical protein